MTPELKEKWVKALRSKDYSQGKGFLCKKGKYCCLGVLADVMGILVKDGNTGYIKAKGLSEWNMYSALPSETLKRIKMTDQEHRSLTFLNDHSGRTFPEIANWIEENL